MGVELPAKNQSCRSNATFIFTEISVSLSDLTISRNFPNEEIAIIVFPKEMAMKYLKLL